MTGPRILPEVVRRARVSRGLSHRELAAKMGITHPTLVRLEQPGHLVTAPQIESVAKALDTTVAELLEDYERTLGAPELERGWRAGDPPQEAFEPPGPARDAQLERLMRATGGNQASVARALGVSRQAVAQALAKKSHPPEQTTLDER